MTTTATQNRTVATISTPYGTYDVLIWYDYQDGNNSFNETCTYKQITDIEPVFDKSDDFELRSHVLNWLLKNDQLLYKELTQI